MYGDQGKLTSVPDLKEIEEILLNLSKKLQGNYPFHHPQYAGQMLKPPHPLSWLAYALTMTINPNNHALDGGPPSSEMENEVIHKLAGMVGYKSGYLGHLTSTGTIANLEALFIAREINPGRLIAASANAHYTHRRMSHLLNVPFLEIPADEYGIPDAQFIKQKADEIGTLVVTMGTTGLGIVEPLKDLVKLASDYNIRIHVDAAYGGFFKTISDTLPSSKHWDVLNLADSIVIDPHKHGLQPYGCGSVLYKNASVGTFFKHDSPYTYFTSDDLHLGEISIECSRAGASAAAFWATLQLLPLTKQGLGSILTKCRSAALHFSQLIEDSDYFERFNQPELDISAYFPIPQEKKLSDVSSASSELFKKGMADKKNGFHVSLFKVSDNEFNKKFPGYKKDLEHVSILRSVFMKEEHETFIPELVNRLTEKFIT